MPGLMLLPTLLSEISSHDLELAETLIGVLRFMLIFVAARTLAEVLVRFELPTILGELLAGVMIGASGLHLLVPPETQVQLSGAFSEVVAGLSHVPVEEIPADLQRELRRLAGGGHAGALFPALPHRS
ncbi:MAG: hypothetical protein CM15mP116_05950 [Synechococcus sp.]|nr:MAG: hypothetical protein CM15mP116_05950 [Synechococcus sp.]